MDQVSSQASLQSSFSLLWPQGRGTDGGQVLLSPSAARDIGLVDVLKSLSRGEEQRKVLEQVLLHPVLDPQVIAYRQQVLADLLRFPRLTASLRRLLPTLEALALDYYRREEQDSSTLFEVAWRLGELESIVACVHALDEAFANLPAAPESAGLQSLQCLVQEMAADPTFQQLVARLPEMLRKMRSSQSVTVGINLDPHLQPSEAVLLAVNEKRFREGGFLSRLLPGEGSRWQGIAPLHDRTPSAGGMMVGTAVPLPSRPSKNLMMEPLFRDLAQVLEKVSQPIARALEAYNRLSSQPFVNLYRDLLFFLAGVQLVERLQAAGMPCCRPELAPAAERLCLVEDNYNVALAISLLIGHEERDLRGTLVTNPIFLGPEAGRIQILTGPNRGGKTTYIQAVGLTQALAQVGLLVPGSRATISPVDGIYTHFPVEERLERGTGRFGDEAQRLKQIFSQATRHSLILLNESLSSTNAGESLYLAQDLLRIMRLMGVRALFTTHMHELAADLDRLNQGTAGDSRIISVVASRLSEETTAESGRDGIERSYQIRPGPPTGRSFAHELARRYGISHEQLLESLQARGVIGEGAAE